MKKITSNLSTVTKVLMIALLMTGVSVDSFAQKDKKAKKEKVIKKPASAGHAATDNFVNSSFDVYERNQKLSIIYYYLCLHIFFVSIFSSSKTS